MLEPAGRVVMVSGGSRGIGRAMVETLHALGYTISAGARDPAALARVLAPLAGERLLCARYEAGDRESHRAWVDATVARFGRLDVLVNNAGTSNGFTIERGEEADLDALIATNLKGPLFLTRLCLPHLRQCGSGRVVNVASLSGKRVRNDRIGYAMTKFALVALTHGTRRLGWKDGIRATALCPGFVATDLTAGMPIPQDEMIDPADLARVAAAIIALPNTASVAELLMSCRLEDTV